MSIKKHTDTQYDYLAKAIIVGDSAVGKSNILLRYVKHEFRASHITTIGVDFRVKTIQVENCKIKMQIWDTAGQERFKAITQTYFRGAHGALLVYSVDNKKSFRNIEGWIKQIQNSQQIIPMIVVGNKCDVERSSRQVSYSEGQQLAQKYNIPFLQCSAKENKNIQEVFMKMGKCIYDNLHKVKNPGKDGLSIHQSEVPHQGCKC